MTEARIENGVAYCPFCGSKKHEIFRRSPNENGDINCLVRCLKCDDTFTVVIDRYDNPVNINPVDPVDNDCPDLPFGGC